MNSPAGACNWGITTENRVILVPFSDVSFPPDGREIFQLTDAEGRTHRVPFHRVREVYKDSQRIWHRPQRDASEGG